MKQIRSGSNAPMAQPPLSASALRGRGVMRRTGAVVAVLLIGGVTGLVMGRFSSGAAAVPGGGAQPVTWSWQLPQLAAEVDADYRRLCEEAAAAVAKVLEMRPDSPHAVSALGILNYLSHDNRGEEACWERCLVLDPGNAFAYSRLFALAQQQANYQRMVELAQRAESQDPQNVAHRAMLGSALMYLQRNAEAKAVLEKHIRSGRGDADAYLTLGEVCFQLNEPREAKRYFEAAVALAPNDPATFYSLAKTCAKLGETELAARHRARFQELKDAEMAGHQGETAAREQIRDALHIPVRVSEILRHVGQAYWQAEAFEKAESNWLRAAELNPDDVESRQLLSELYRREGRFEDALTWVRDLQRIEPQNRLHDRNEGVLLTRLERYDEAESVFRGLCRRDPTASFGYAALAGLLAQRGGDLSEAESLARRAVEFEPSGPHLFLLASVAQRAGHLDLARQAITQALVREPDNPQYRQLADSVASRN